MAQYIGIIKGQRGEASRLGSKVSGMTAHINGWNLGIYVSAVHINGKDTFRIWKTEGSNGGINQELITEITE